MPVEGRDHIPSLQNNVSRCSKMTELMHKRRECVPFFLNNIWGRLNIPRYASYTYREGWSRYRKDARDQNLSISYSREFVRIKTHDGRQPVDESPGFNNEWQPWRSGPSPPTEYIVVTVVDYIVVGWMHHIALEVD